MTMLRRVLSWLERTFETDPHQALAARGLGLPHHEAEFRPSTFVPPPPEARLLRSGGLPGGTL